MFSKLILISGTICLYLGISLKIFEKVHSTSQLIIDELFHIPQGLRFCESNFTYWDPKITTLPGLYIVSYIFIKPILGCSVYSLRLTNLIASSMNIYLLASLLKRYYKSDSPKYIAQAFNIAFLPPLYFFSHVYYTDTLSVMFVLLFVKVYMDKGPGILLILFGAFSILIRQTNVVWIALCLGNSIIDLFMNSYIEGQTHGLYKKNILYSIEDLIPACEFHLKTRLKWIYKCLNFNVIVELSSMLIILSGFVIFVLINGSIVVGDKSAHTASIHIPQLLYFLLFYGIFSMPYVYRNIENVFTDMLTFWKATCILIVLCLIIVHYNTLVHPYLLADNRHYTFYIWNRFYGKYYLAKYIMAPVYVFLLISLCRNVKSSNFSFLLPFLFCIFAAVGLQRMIEVRYFILPYVFLKMRFDEPSWSTIMQDFLFNVVINGLTLYVFFTKKIFWDDMPDVQRLIW